MKAKLLYKNKVFLSRNQIILGIIGTPIAAFLLKVVIIGIFLLMHHFLDAYHWRVLWEIWKGS